MTIETSETGLAELFGAMATAQGQMTGAAKDGKAEAGSRRERSYATLQSALEAVRPALAANGIALTQWVSDAEGRVVVSTLLGHSGGGWVRSEISTSTQGLQQKGVQAVGSAITYLRRYALMAACGIAPDDDDGHAAGVAQQSSRPRGASKASPGGKPAHHPTWTQGGNKAFCAKLGEAGLTYKAVADYLEARGRQRPSSLDPKNRNSCLTWVLANPSKFKEQA